MHMIKKKIGKLFAFLLKQRVLPLINLVKMVYVLREKDNTAESMDFESESIVLQH